MYALNDAMGISSSQENPGMNDLSLAVASNPFSDCLGMEFATGAGRVTLSVYDIGGRAVETVVSGSMGSGTHSAVWTPERSLPAGVYTVVLRNNGSAVTENAVLVR